MVAGALSPGPQRRFLDGVGTSRTWSRLFGERGFSTEANERRGSLFPSFAWCSKNPASIAATRLGCLLDFPICVHLGPSAVKVRASPTWSHRIEARGTGCGATRSHQFWEIRVGFLAQLAGTLAPPGNASLPASGPTCGTRVSQTESRSVKPIWAVSRSVKRGKAFSERGFACQAGISGRKLSRAAGGGPLFYEHSASIQLSARN